MPAIWNIGKSNEYSNKKICSKLTFEEGETFKGMVVGKSSDSDSVIVRLMDGWQFPAELLEDSNLEGQQLVQFKVEGFEDGKLKLKVVNDLKDINESVDEDIVKDFIQKKGMSKEDLSILKAMVKFNLPLTKENIEFVKSVFDFNNRVNIQDAIEDFISKYIAGKGIDSQSADALVIKNTLTDFFNAFKTMTKDDILLFLENNIDINQENIESYNKLFKSDVNLNEYFENVYKNFQELNLDKNNFSGISHKVHNITEEIDPKIIEDNNKNIDISKTIKYTQNQNAGLRIYDESTSSKSRVSLLNLLKTITGNEDNLTKDAVKDILIENKNIFKGLELNDAFNKLDNMSEDEVKNILKNYIDKNGVTKEAIIDTIKELFGKEVKLSDGEAAKFEDILNFKSNDSQSLKNNDNIVKNNDNTILKNETSVKENGEIIKDILSKEDNTLESEVKVTSSNLIKHEMNGKVESIKDIIKEILSHSEELKSRSLESKVADFIKSNLNDFKLFNSISNEYYYLDIPIRRDAEDYPCKLIIKDDRKGNKKIDSSNVKMVVAVKTINMGTVDAYLTVMGNNLNVDIKCLDKFTKLLSRGKDQLSSKLEELGYYVNINVTEKIEDVTLTSCREFFDDGNTLTLDTKV